jgi:hypothetical protein
MLRSPAVLSLFLSLLVFQAGCALRERHWAPQKPFALRLEGGTQWGWIERSDCSDWVGPVAEAQLDGDGSARVNLKKWGVHLTTQAPDLDVFLPMKKQFGQGFTSSAATALRVLRVSDGGVVLTPAPRADLQPSEAFTPVSATCDELRLNAGGLTLDFYQVEATAELKVLDRPDGGVIATIPKSTRLRLGSLDGASTFVTAMLGDDSELSGWIRGRLQEDGYLHYPGRHGSALCEDFPGKPPPTECPGSLELFATDGQRLAPITTINAHTFLDLKEKGGELVELRLRDQPFEMARGWRLVARAEALTGCAPAYELKR